MKICTFWLLSLSSYLISKSLHPVVPFPEILYMHILLIRQFIMLPQNKGKLTIIHTARDEVFTATLAELCIKERKNTAQNMQMFGRLLVTSLVQRIFHSNFYPIKSLLAAHITQHLFLSFIKFHPWLGKTIAREKAHL